MIGSHPYLGSRYTFVYAGTLKCLSCKRTVHSSKTDPNDGPPLCEDCAAEASHKPYILM